MLKGKGGRGEGGKGGRGEGGKGGRGEGGKGEGGGETDEAAGLRTPMRWHTSIGPKLP